MATGPQQKLPGPAARGSGAPAVAPLRRDHGGRRPSQRGNVAAVRRQQEAGEGAAGLGAGVHAVSERVLDLEPHLVPPRQGQDQRVRGGPRDAGRRAFDDGLVVVEEADLEDALVDGQVVAEDVGAVGRRRVDAQVGVVALLGVGKDPGEDHRGVCRGVTGGQSRGKG